MYIQAAVAAALAGLAAAGPLAVSPRSGYTVGPFVTCSASDKAQTSCRNTTAIEDDCCIETRGGQLLATQFWDAKPPKGPTASWTIHGLWPDRCDGSYEGFCDPSREVTGDQITAIIEYFGGHNLLRYMRRYWKDNASVDGSLWSHEYNKHATCFSSGRQQCYSDFSPTADLNATSSRKDVFDFFYRTTEIFKTLDTYAALAEAGVVPSLTRTYTLDEIKGALKRKFGVTPTVGCDKETNELTEMWYHFHVKGGNVYNGEYLPIDGGKSFCNATGIVYTPKKL
ncbi:ribonuclease T2-like [Orbilia brochopaga]|uniref:ribonuclease T2 n=1 Tax=Orbilia brochopaga TaxID=3140254 RepID=A0AAV9UIB3_9PEZI